MLPAFIGFERACLPAAFPYPAVMSTPSPRWWIFATWREPCACSPPSSPWTFARKASEHPRGMTEALGIHAPLLEIALRTAVVYLAIVLGMRLTGRRQLGQMTPFDLVLILLIANAVQNAMVG